MVRSSEEGQSTMSAETQGTITRILDRWSGGDVRALEDLMEKVYGDLAKQAAAFMRHERDDHTLQTADLLNEAYLRLESQNQIQWRNRSQFHAIAAQIMRRILVDHVRKYLYQKRGGGAQKLKLDEALEFTVEQSPELVALDDALTDLATLDPRQAEIIELRFFAGMTHEEIATALDISVATVKREWRMARNWLYHVLSREDTEDTEE